MKTEIIVALIGASAVIVGAIIAALATIISTHKKSREDGRPESNTVTGDNNITLVGNKNNIL